MKLNVQSNERIAFHWLSNANSHTSYTCSKNIVHVGLGPILKIDQIKIYQKI